MIYSAFVEPVRRNGPRESILESTEAANIAWLDTEVRAAYSTLETEVGDALENAQEQFGAVLALLRKVNGISSTIG